MPDNRGHEWQVTREEIISARGRYCQVCRRAVLKPESILLHHIDLDKMNDYDGNLMLLCSKCY